MPISPSPLVQGYMQQDQQPQGAPVTADQMFEKNFSDAAFAQLRSKFPQLMQYVVTLKVFDADVQEGKAFGAFILQDGKGILYAPVVMADGSVTSCEMLYNKNGDSFVPMSAETVRKVMSDNMLMSGEMMNGNVHVDDTKDIFRNMIRPPASSNVVMAGEHGVEALPNAAKEAVSAWLNGNPEALAKIAASYDVAELAVKLAPRQEKAAAQEDSFITKKEAADLASLDAGDKQALLRDGFLVKKAESNGSAVASAHDIDVMAEKEFSLEEYVPQAKLSADKTVRKGSAVVADGRNFRLIPCVMIGNDVLFAGGAHLRAGYGSNTRLLVQGITDEVTEKDLRAVGAKAIRQAAREGVDRWSDFFVVTPTKNGKWKAVPTVATGSDFSVVGEDAYLCGVHASPAISYGFVRDNEASSDRYLVPAASLVIVRSDSSFDGSSVPKGLVRTFDEFRHIVLMHGRQLTTRTDGPSVNIVDHGDGSSSNFTSKTAAARWLFDKFAMDQEQINTVLGNHATVIFEKSAFMVPPQVDPNTGMEAPMDAPVPGMAPQAPMQPNGMPMQPQFDPAMVQAGIDVGGQDMVDAGILASFAQDPDIKALLVDYMPYFLQMLDKLGRVILLLCLEKKGMEEQYGVEKYSDLLASCRKMFKMLGAIVHHLKRYVNMA